MKRGDLQKLIQDFAATGGNVVKLPELSVSVNWAETKLHRAARAASARGHARRRQLRGACAA